MDSRASSVGALAVTLLLLLGACATDEPAPRPDPSRAAGTGEPVQPEESGQQVRPVTANPVIRRVPPGQWRRMKASGVWRDSCPLGREDLRRVEVGYVDFDGRARRGVLVVNADVAHSVARIFTRLFKARFPIRRMKPIEVYDGDRDRSLAADNTSAYNCRRSHQTIAPSDKSPHANGRAIDINPRENPWKDPECDCWSPAGRHHKRRPGTGVILEGDVVWRAFTREGWRWQIDGKPDYMHFDTGYPSSPYRDQFAEERR